MPSKAGTTQSVTVAERDSEHAVWLFGILFSIHRTQYVLLFGNHLLQLAKMLD
jgi:hypothetical protein